MNITLDQWLTLIAVVEQGSYNKAAEYLGKSQSTLSYAIQKLEASLEIQVFNLKGRKAVLTTAGDLLYRRAVHLIAMANSLESTAKKLSNHWQPQINLAVDTVFPSDLLFQALASFSKVHPLTRVNLQETTLSGSNDALIKREVSLTVTGQLTPGFIGEPLINIKFLAVAAPSHPLHQLKRPIDFSDLQAHRQLVVRDSGRMNIDAGWLEAEQRWSFSQLSTSIQAAIAGLGFAWYPEAKIHEHLKQKLLKPLPLTTGSERFSQLYLVYADQAFASPTTQQLGQALIEVSQRLSVKN